MDHQLFAKLAADKARRIMSVADAALAQPAPDFQAAIDRMGDAISDAKRALASLKLLRDGVPEMEALPGETAPYPPGNVLRTWLESRVELDPAAETELAAVHLDIETYCATAGYRHPGSQHVSRFLADRQFSRGRRRLPYCDGHVHTVKGLRLKPKAEPESLRLARAH